LEGRKILHRASVGHFYSTLFFGDFKKIIEVENRTPEWVSPLAFLLFFVLLSTFFESYILKFEQPHLMIPSLLLVEGFLKIVNSMLCRSPQIELFFACIWKHVKYYFGDFFGE
jgi:hypothetical protein